MHTTALADMSLTIRLARESDAEQLLGIYARIVRETAISFELVPPTVEEFRERLRSVLASHAWLVCEEDGTVCGYTYASKFRPREAYQWTAEVTVYVGGACQGRGIASALYRSLFGVLRLQGFHTAVAVIALPNPASVSLHEKLGFRPVGVFRSVGYKLGKWHDTGWWQLQLGTHATVPAPPRPISALLSSPAWDEALAEGLAIIDTRRRP